MPTIRMGRFEISDLRLPFLARLGLCSNTINLGGFGLPAPTASNPPIPSRFNSFSSRTRNPSPADFATSCATLARLGGLISFPGRDAIVRARFCPSARIRARSSAALALEFPPTSVNRADFSFASSPFLLAVPLYSRKEKLPSRKPVASASTSPPSLSKSGATSATFSSLCRRWRTGGCARSRMVMRWFPGRGWRSWRERWRRACARLPRRNRARRQEISQDDLDEYEYSGGVVEEGSRQGRCRRGIGCEGGRAARA